MQEQQREAERPRRTADLGHLPRRAAVAGAALALYDDPMSKVLGLDAKTSTLRRWLGFTPGGAGSAARA